MDLIEAQALTNEVRTPNDLDLITAVRDMLVKGGMPSDVIQQYDSNRYIQLARNKVPMVQRTLLNQFWNFMLLTVASESIEQRRCLINDGEVADWLRLFEAYVLPFAIKHQLPVVL